MNNCRSNDKKGLNPNIHLETAPVSSFNIKSHLLFLNRTKANAE